MRRRHAIRPGRCAAATSRPALSLAELVVAAGLTALTALAGSSMLFAAARSSGLTHTARTAALRGHSAMERLKVLVTQARTVQVSSSSKMSVWAVDDYPNPGIGGVPGNDAPEASEVHVVEYDAAGKRLIHRWTDLSTADPGLIPTLNVRLDVSLGDLDAQLSLEPPLDAYERSEVWAVDVTSFTMTAHLKNTQVNAVAIAMQTGAGDDAQVFQATFALRCPAYYLQNGGESTNDGLSGFRLRRTVIPAW